MASSLFEQYGGFAKISRIVGAFYDKVMESDELAPYFKHTDMRRQIDHQTKFVASLMGGPASYSDQELKRIHERLNIDDSAFGEICVLLQETLEDFEVEDNDIDTIVGAMGSKKPFIVRANA